MFLITASQYILLLAVKMMSSKHVFKAVSIYFNPGLNLIYSYKLQIVIRQYTYRDRFVFCEDVDLLIEIWKLFFVERNLG